MHSFEAEGREFESLRARYLLLLYPAPIWSHFLFVPGSGLTVINHETAILFLCCRRSHFLFQGSDAPAPTTPIVALGFRIRMTHHAQRSQRNAPPRSPTLALRQRELDEAQRLPCLAARIVDDFAIIVEEHRRATFGVVRRPIRQAFVVRVPSSREGNPS